MVMSALLGTASAGIGVAVERQLGFYDRMELSPLGPSISQIGRRLGDGTRIALFVVVLSCVGWAAGAEVTNWPLALGVTIPLATMLGMAYGGLAYSLCLRTGSAEAAQAVTPLFLPALFMSTAFVPLPLIPHWLRPVVEHNPLSAVCEAIRLAYAGQVGGAAILRSVVEIGILAAVTQTLILRAESRVRNR
jgi:ABC-2 type transport system permease protein